MSLDPVPPAACPHGALAAFQLGLTVANLLHTVPWCYVHADEDETPPLLRLSTVCGELDRLLTPPEGAEFGILEVGQSVRAIADRLIGATHAAWHSDDHRTWFERRKSLWPDGVAEESGETVAAFTAAPIAPEWDAARASAEGLADTQPAALGALYDLGRAVGEVLTPVERYRGGIADPIRWLHGTLAARVEQLLSAAHEYYPQLSAVPDLPYGADAGGVPPCDGMTTAIQRLADQIPVLLTAPPTGVVDPPAATAIPPVAG